MREAILIPPRDGEVVGDAPDRRVEILSDDDSLHATWSRFGPRRDGADLHVHHEHTDLFYVLDGRLTVRLGLADRAVGVPAGTLARVPPFVVHGFRNGGDAEVRYLNLHAPGRRFADFLRALRDGRTFSYDQHAPPPDGGRPISDAVVGGDVFVSVKGGVRVTVRADVEKIAVAEIVVEPGSLPAPNHVHDRHVESFYVLEGEMTLTAGGRDLHAAAGSWVQVPAGMPHSFRTSPAGVRFLDLHTPSCGFGAFMRAVHEAASDDELAAARAAFDQRDA